jgi:2,4-didehydro-3-deoxy-L-rhamnonate hydrolase
MAVERASMGACQDATMAMPLDPRPGKVLAIARNYADHAAERGAAPPAEPMAFLKPASCLIGPGEPIVLPALSTQVDVEAELAVVIGRTARAVPAARALDHVAGYTIMNDVTARDLQRTDGQWARAKGMDTFGPVGPRVVPAAEVADPHALRIRLWLSGEPMQDGSTADMLHRIPR